MYAPVLQMIQLKLDPEGDNIFSQTQFPSITNTGLGSVDTQKINELSKQVKELKEELEKCRVREGGRNNNRNNDNNNSNNNNNNSE